MRISLNQQFPRQHTRRPRSGRLFLARLRGACLAPALLLPTFAQAQTIQGELPTVDLYAGMHRIVAEQAVSADERAIGLMGRTSLPENGGMLFVFETKAVHCFWMANTLIPLSIAFLRDDGTIVNIVDMQPQSRQSHCPKEPVRFALEMNQGWFAQRHIVDGVSIRGLPNSVTK